MATTTKNMGTDATDESLQGSNEGTPKGKSGKEDKVYMFTFSDLAAVTGLRDNSLGTYIRQGKINPNDLESVVAYCVKKRSAQAARMEFGDKNADELKEVEKLLSIGVNPLGNREDGSLVFTLPFPETDQAFAEIGKTAKQKLSRGGYMQGTWQLKNGSTASGYSMGG